jgi:integrase
MFLQKKSNGFFYVIFAQPNGKRTSVSTKTKRESEAGKFLTRFKKEEYIRQDLGVIPISIRQYEFHYFRYAEQVYTDKTTQGIKSTFNQLIKHFGDIQLHQLTKRELEEYFLIRLKQNSPFSAKRDLAYISGALKKAVSEGYLNFNPCEGIKSFRLPEKLPVYYSKEDYLKLIAVIDNQDIKDIVQFAVNTGLRQMEIITLKWKQVNLEERNIILDNQGHLTKTKRVRNVPINQNTYEVLKQRKENIISEYVFTYQGGIIRQDFLVHKFKKYVYKAKINPELNFHSLRHTFASWLIQKGAQIYQVSKLLGHTNLSTTEIYSHLRRDDLLSTSNMLNDL